MSSPAVVQRTGRRLPAPLSWALCLVLGLAFGELCRVPLVTSWLTVRVIGQEAGWAPFDGTFDEGVGLWLTAAAVLWCLFAVLAGTLTLLAWRWTPVSARAWWWTTAVLWLAPFAVLDVPSLP